jgi:hypothetical protein
MNFDGDNKMALVSDDSSLSYEESKYVFYENSRGFIREFLDNWNSQIEEVEDHGGDATKLIRLYAEIRILMNQSLDALWEAVEQT